VPDVPTLSSISIPLSLPPRAVRGRLSIATSPRRSGLERSSSSRRRVSVAIPLGIDEANCPVGALQRWLEHAEIFDGRVFRRIDRHNNIGAALFDRAVAEIVQRRAADVGLEGEFTAHSMRSGLATSAAHAGRPRRRSCGTGAGAASWWRGATSGRGSAGTTTRRLDSYKCELRKRNGRGEAAGVENYVWDVEEAATRLHAQDYRGEKKPIARLERCGTTA
jgi:hypothetical protein